MAANEIASNPNRHRKGVGMYFEEQMIDGILHHRSDPNDAFIAYTAKELSARVRYLEGRLQDIRHLVN